MKIYPVSTTGALALCLCLNAFAQSGASFSDRPGVTIHLQEPAVPLPTVFSHFEVIDQRSDTGRIGIHTFLPTFGHPRGKQLLFPSPAATEIAGWLNTYFTRKDGPYTALIVLRSLWLSDAS